jgi:hypothetical protein
MKKATISFGSEKVPTSARPQALLLLMRDPATVGTNPLCTVAILAGSFGRTLSPSFWRQEALQRQGGPGTYAYSAALKKVKSGQERQ